MNLICLVLLQLLTLFPCKYKAAHQPYRDSDPDYAASVHHLKLLAIEELNLLPQILNVLKEPRDEGSQEVDLNNYVMDFIEANMGHLEEKALSLEQFAFLLRQDYINLDSFAEDIVKHPIKSFRTIRRYIRYLSKIPDITSEKGMDYVKHLFRHFVTLKFEQEKPEGKFRIFPELLDSFRKTMERIKLPKATDLKASMLNILRLRKIFKLSVSDLMDGHLDNLQTKSGLNIETLMEIAECAASLRMFTHAIDFFEEIIKRCSILQFGKDCSNLNLSHLQLKLIDIIEEHDQIIQKSSFDRTDFDIVPPDSAPFIYDNPLENLTSPNFINRKSSIFDQLENLQASIRKEYNTERDFAFAISPVYYEKLCRGDIKKDMSEMSTLNCFYSFGPHPTYILGPLKVETHSEVPHIIQIYDVLTANEIKRFQDEVQGDMRISRTTGAAGGDERQGEVSRFRTSANAWILDNDDVNFQYFNKRISRIVGLNLTGYYSSEIVQIAAYNPGGHYSPHSDALFEEQIINSPNFPETEIQRGDRLMTFMVYLSDVEKGGCTGFSMLKTLVCPVKGSAVIWHNLKSDGSINYRMIHGGCPVLYGTKWIANKWIRSNDQMFIRKCPLDRNEQLKIL